MLLLPQLPVSEVTLIEERRLSDDVTVAGGADTWVSLVGDTDYEVDLAEGVVWRRSGVAGLREWPVSADPRGVGGRVRITYTHGFLPDDIPETIRTVVLRVAARGYLNPEAVSSETVGKVVVGYGQSPGLYLSKTDIADLTPWRAGSRGGSK